MIVASGRTQPPDAFIKEEVVGEWVRQKMERQENRYCCFPGRSWDDGKIGLKRSTVCLDAKETLLGGARRAVEFAVFCWKKTRELNSDYSVELKHERSKSWSKSWASSKKWGNTGKWVGDIDMIFSSRARSSRWDTRWARAPTGSAAGHHVFKMEVDAFEIRVDDGEGWTCKYHPCVQERRPY